MKVESFDDGITRVADDKWITVKDIEASYEKGRKDEKEIILDIIQKKRIEVNFLDNSIFNQTWIRVCKELEERLRKK